MIEKKRLTPEEQLMYRKNFIGKDGGIYLVYCYQCDSENYASSVASGICVWCGWGEKENEKIQNRG